MNFSTAFKVFQLNLLRQSGVAVTPQQVGLKSDPIAELQAKSAASGTFGNILGNLKANQTLQAPQPPTPPADPTDAAAQTQYQQELLAYTQNIQLYHQRFMQMMMNQLQQMQQSLAANQKSSTSADAGVSGASLGVGGIL